MAAAKPSYRIPYSLLQSYGDMTIALQSKDGSVGRVVPFVAVASYVVSGLTCMLIVSKTFIGTYGSTFEVILFCLLWAALTVVLSKYDGTRRMNMQRIVTLLNYLPPASRRIYTRKTKSAIPFFNVVGIEKVDEDGMVHYADGTYGYFYRVVGSASILLFEADQESILTRVDNFFKKWQTDSEIIFITAKEGQKVYRQLAHLHDRYANLQNDDPDLRDLAEEQFRILRNYVGKEFKSIHQYMIIKSDNSEALRVANGILQTEVENSALFIKQCVPLERDDTLEVLRSVYQKGDA